MTHPAYLALRDQILDVMWKRGLFPEQRADEIMRLCGIEYEDTEPKEGE
jgi:hypothetical protein